MFHSPSQLARETDEVDFSTYLTGSESASVKNTGDSNQSDILLEPDVTGFASDAVDGVVSSPDYDVAGRQQYVNDALQGLGFTTTIAVQGDDEQAHRAILETIFSLIQQRRRDVDFRQASNEEKKKLKHENQNLRDALQTTRKDLDRTQRELEHQKYKLVAAEKTWKKTQDKMEKERAKVDLKATQIANRDQQYQHEIRKKERVYEKLQKRMQTMMADRDRAAKAGMAILNKLQRADGRRAQWGAGKPGKASEHEQEMLQQVIATYEDKHKLIVDENEDLRQSLKDLRSELDELLAERANMPDTETVDGDDGEQNEDTIAIVRQAQYELPFAMAKGDIEGHLRSKLSELRSQVRVLSADDISTMNADALKVQLEELRKVIQEQDALLQFSLASAAPGAAGPAAGLDDSTALIADSDAAVTNEERQLFEASRRALQDERAKLTDALLELGAERTRLMEERKRYEAGNTRGNGDFSVMSTHPLFSPPVASSTPVKTPGPGFGTPLFLKSFRRRSTVKHTPTPSNLVLTPLTAKAGTRVLNDANPRAGADSGTPTVTFKRSARSLSQQMMNTSTSQVGTVDGNGKENVE